jgi:deazaflavin-dependent oxidoreductase (nitroreductase family)
MMSSQLSQLESSFFSLLNRFAEPLVRAGFGNPILWPTGAIVLETIGRRTRQTYNVPLLATRVGDILIVSTFRRRSQWLKNLAANTKTRYWMGGRLHEATAFVIAHGFDAPATSELPPLASCIAEALARQSRLFGGGFAILVPANIKGRNPVSGPGAGIVAEI